MKIKEFAKRLPENFAQRGLYEIFKSIAITIIPTTIVCEFARQFFQKFIIPCTIIAFCIIYLIVSSIINKRTIKNEASKEANSSLDCEPYIYTKKEIEYIYEDKKTIKYIIKYSIKSLRNDLKLIEGRYHWSGKGKITISVLNQEYEFFETKKDDMYQLYVVYFTNPLAYGEEADVDIVWNITVEEEPIPFLGNTIDVQTNHLKMTLRLNSEHFKAEKIYFRKLKMSKQLQSTKEGFALVGNYHQSIWDIPNPELGCRYKMSWEFI